jgi:hypothetical protein
VLLRDGPFGAMEVAPATDQYVDLARKVFDDEMPNSQA